MRPQSSRALYLLLALYIVASITFYGLNVAGFVDGYLNVFHHARVPFDIDFEQLTVTDLQPEAKAAGLAKGHIIESLNGQPYSGRAHWVKTVRHVSPNTPIRVGVRQPDGQSKDVFFRLQPEGGPIGPVSEWLSMVLLGISVPLVCLLVGYWVVAARPRDPNAWLVLVLLSLPEVLFRFNPDTWPGVWFLLLPVWYWPFRLLGPSALLWFSLYFPERSRIDKRLPWLKWIILLPQVAGLVLYLCRDYGLNFDPSWNRWTVPGRSWIDQILNPIQLLCFVLCPIVVFDKLKSTSMADVRRRMRVLLAGTILGLGTLLFIIILLPRLGIDFNKNQWLAFTLTALLFAFPLSVAYVVVVQRAMDIRILLRMGTKYALARGTVWVLRMALIIALTILLVQAIRAPQLTTTALVRIALLAVALLLVRSRISGQLLNWLDRKFFREAYDAELVLSELSEQARTFTEKGPLVETVLRRVSDVLHVPQAAVLLRGSEVFQLQQAVGLNFTGPLLLPQNSSTVQTLARTERPVTLYRENPDQWFLQADEEERRTLNEMKAELLLALPGRERLMGVMALGPKRSEEPYTPSDLRLLQSVATQTGLALEISELAQSLANEAAQRERIHREIEIAREVQERLFPQQMPSIEGVGLAGACRPAQIVGGDYYDVIPLADGLLGLAIGDVSGKGISAALLMASLRASLRGMTLYGTGDLAELMRKVNCLVYEASSSNRYATFFFAVYQPATRELRYVNAGHNPPILMREAKGGLVETRLLETGGPVIGLLRDVCFSEGSETLKPGDLLLTYTDGISEAMTAEDEEWGEVRMLAATQRVRGKSAEEILSAIFEAADVFIAGAPQHDDMTLLIMKL